MKMALPPDIPMYQTATSNWTHPNNVWHNNNPADPLVICDVQPSIHPPLADHLPIYTELDLPIPRASSITTRNMRDTDFTIITNNLKQLLSEHCPAIPICSKRELDRAVDTLIQCVNDVIYNEVPPSKPCLFTKRWWTKELTKLKKEKNRLRRISYRYCATPDHPIHIEHKEAANKLNNRINEMKKAHWTDWLEEVSSKDIYIVNKYVTSEPSDYSSTRIPPLKVHNKELNQYFMATDNSDKAKALTNAFFPPPPLQSIIPDSVYPEPLKARGSFSRNDICNAVRKLKPYKAPGEDCIQNIVLQHCIEAIIDHLYYIFRAVLELDAYPSRWLIILTIVLWKAGKTAYNVAKSYQPIGLLDTLGKLFSTLVAADLVYIAEKYNLLPTNQFGGWPGHCTTDAIHLVI